MVQFSIIANGKHFQQVVKAHICKNMFKLKRPESPCNIRYLLPVIKVYLIIYRVFFLAFYPKYPCILFNGKNIKQLVAIKYNREVTDFFRSKIAHFRKSEAILGKKQPVFKLTFFTDGEKGRLNFAVRTHCYRFNLSLITVRIKNFYPPVRLPFQVVW